MITKEVTQIQRIRDRDGNPRKKRTKRNSFAYDFDKRGETCGVTTFRFLGIPFYRRVELLHIRY